MTAIDTGEINKVRGQGRKIPQDKRWSNKVDTDLATGYRRDLIGSPIPTSQWNQHSLFPPILLMTIVSIKNNHA